MRHRASLVEKTMSRSDDTGAGAGNALGGGGDGDDAERLLHAYVDGQLPPAERAAFARRLAEDSALARTAEAYSRQGQALHAAFDPVLREPLPVAWTRPPPVRRRPWRGIAARAAAALALLSIGAGGGYWTARQTAPAEPVGQAALAERAALAYATYVPEVRHPVEVPASQQDHLQSWLSKRVGTTIKAPMLNDLGYRLVGGRLLPDRPGPAAQFMYEDSQGRRLTLYIRRDAGVARDSAFRWLQVGKISLCTWVDARVSYALAAEVGRSEMQGVAAAVYHQTVVE